mmetsp:Transcript_27866/g.75084  ORF Transcript_27866/g.75084 Transcript_27866/m.75084 type:complete len:396 (+) Transcript_27866:61-1248(+)
MMMLLARRLSVPVACAALVHTSRPASMDVPPASSSSHRKADGIGSDRAAPHFRVYSRNGEVTSLNEVVDAMAGANVALVGEAHDDPVAHQLELYLLMRVHARANEEGARKRVVLSLEQFERDTQATLDEYLAGVVREQDLLMDTRPWGNYDTDYRPMVEYAKARGMRVVAANAPRRYVTIAGSKGLPHLESLHTAAKYLPPLPLPPVSVDYKAHFQWAHVDALADAQGMAEAAPPLDASSVAYAAAARNHQQHNDGGGCPYIGLNAQAESLLDPIILWDATMAHAIYSEADAASLVVHICGSFHSEYSLGIAEFLRHYDSSSRAVPSGAKGDGASSDEPRRVDPLRMVVVTIYPEEHIDSFDPVRHQNAGDFVILTDAHLPRSHDANSHRHLQQQ